MIVTSAVPQPVPPRPRTVVEWIDHKTTPRPETDGDFERPAYVQVALGAGVEGLMLGGLEGSLSALAGGLSGVFVESRTGSTVAGVATGAVVGGAVAAGMSGGALPAVFTGTLLGAFQALGGSPQARVRDSSDMGAVMGGLVFNGPTKVIGGLAGATAQRIAGDRSPGVRAALGASLGAALGAATAVVMPGGPGLVGSVAAGALFGGLSPLVGPRWGQFVRNMSVDAGVAAEAGLHKVGVIDGPLSPLKQTLLGAVPVGLATEMTKAAIYADGSLTGILIGGVAQTFQVVDALLESRRTCESQSEDVLSTTG